jgi:hypothetical protein
MEASDTDALLEPTSLRKQQVLRMELLESVESLRRWTTINPHITFSKRRIGCVIALKTGRIHASRRCIHEKRNPRRQASRNKTLSYPMILCIDL